jgi:hypothetical protein
MQSNYQIPLYSNQVLLYIHAVTLAIAITTALPNAAIRTATIPNHKHRGINMLLVAFA